MTKEADPAHLPAAHRRSARRHYAPRLPTCNFLCHVDILRVIIIDSTLLHASTVCRVSANNTYRMQMLIADVISVDHTSNII